jgi:hypothetical protein
LKSGRVSGSFAFISMNVRVLDYDSKKGTLLAECNIKGTTMKLRFFVATQIQRAVTSVWLGQVASLEFDSTGYIEHVGEAMSLDRVDGLQFVEVKEWGRKILLIFFLGEERRMRVALPCTGRVGVRPEPFESLRIWTSNSGVVLLDKTFPRPHRVESRTREG